ncbi:MAG: AMP-binding protein [Actinobacteria bacterium]|nr:AMP-binding protein [Actinomycetota bacterium]
MLTNWIYADVLEAIALEQPDAPAISQGATRRSWKALIDRSRSLGAAFLDAGLGHQSKIALYTYNAPEYLEGVVAALLAPKALCALLMTSSCSTRVGPPACPRASCGAKTTSSRA